MLGSIGLHRPVAERLHQDVVRLAPVRLGRVGGEEAVAGDRAHPAQWSAHRLVETLLVAECVDDGSCFARSAVEHAIGEQAPCRDANVLGGVLSELVLDA